MGLEVAQRMELGPLTKAEEIDDPYTSQFAQAILVYVVALVPALPLFLLLRPFLPDLATEPFFGVRVDHFLFFLVLLAALIVLVRHFRREVFALLVASLLALTASTLMGSYGIGDLLRGYTSLVGMLRTTDAGTPLASGRFAPFKDAFQLQALVENTSPALRKAAVKMATAHFKDQAAVPDDHTLVQSFSIFKEINSHWQYVSDRKGGEYFAAPEESNELMAGDCDDYAVLMAACIKAVGGEVRLVRTEGHIYPELRVGDDKDLKHATRLIREKLFKKQARHAPLHHHTDAEGVHWINLDYTRPYPGGELMDERIMGILEL